MEGNMDTLVIKNSEGKTELVPGLNKAENKKNSNDSYNGWIIGKEFKKDTSEAELFYAYNPDGRKGVFKLFKTTHVINLEVYEKLKKVKHPNVVEIYECGIKNGRQFVIEQLLEGQSLNNTTLPFEKKDLWQMIHDLNSALRSIHKCRIVHRDLKPSNIILHNGRFIIIDFGISRFITDTTEDYSHTPGYSAPELFVNDFSYEYDYYAFGFVIYYAFTGKNPFAGRGNKYLYQDMLENITKKDFSTRPEVQAQTDRLQKLLLGLITNDVTYRFGYKEVFKWLYHIPFDARQKISCNLDFGYTVQSESQFVEALYNSPEVLIRPLLKESVELYSFLSAINKFKAKQILKGIRKLKIKSQKDFLNWIYDYQFEFKVISFVREIYKKCSPPL